eukprot:3020773-Pyramimonas_sp.AAC.1
MRPGRFPVALLSAASATRNECGICVDRSASAAPFMCLGIMPRARGAVSTARLARPSRFAQATKRVRRSQSQPVSESRSRLGDVANLS